MAFLPFILSFCILLLVVDGRIHNLQEKQYSFAGSQDLKSTSITIQNDVECVDIHKQPAFQNPLLKSHKIQLYPTFLRKTMQSKSSSNDENVRVDNSKGCPPGKVPIPKTTKMKHQQNNISALQVEDFHEFSQSYPGHHFATLDTMTNAIYHGANASLSVFNISVQPNQYSLTQVWVQSGPPAELNSIQAGIGIHPSLYGDLQPRLIGYWTVDNFQKTGCFNILCSGFVQVDGKLTFGEPFIPSSEIGDRHKQYSILTRIEQDKSTGNWWLTTRDAGILVTVGYWPKEIFTHLQEEASLIRFGGETYTPPNMDSPPMGSGYLPETKFLHSAFMARLQIVDSNYDYVDINPHDMKPNCDTNPSCYGLLYHGYEGIVFWQALLFGGPGGQCGI